MIGKLAPPDLERLVLARLGAPRAEVVLGPRTGSDCGIVRVGAGRVLVMTADPLSLVPALGPERSARLSCRAIASDHWTSGIPPAYAAVTLNLPPDLGDATLEAYAEAMHREWARLDVAVVTGHTGRYDGCAPSIVGAVTLSGVGDEGRWVGAPFVQQGDVILLTKGCAIEATGIAAHLFPRTLEARLAERLPGAEEVAAALDRAAALLDQASVVDDCLAVLRVGVRDRGVSMLHDATEGGVLGGLLELAAAVRCDLRVERGRIPVGIEARAACAAFGIDPYWTLSQGSLIVVVRPDRADEALAALGGVGIPAATIGEVVRGDGRVWLTEPDGSVTSLREPLPDPYWPAYARAVREAWT